MPVQAPLAKVSATRGYGARVILHGEVFDEAHAEALRIAAARGPDATSTPSTIQRSWPARAPSRWRSSRRRPSSTQLVVPIGGGGLIAGIAVAAKALRPDLRDLRRPGARRQRHRARLPRPVHRAARVADDDRRRPAHPLAGRAHAAADPPLRGRRGRPSPTKSIAEAVVLLMERSKTVAEPAGAVALAALLSGAVDGRGPSELRGDQRRQRRPEHDGPPAAVRPRRLRPAPATCAPS